MIDPQEIHDKKPRTGKQNNSLHLYCRLLADALNEAGLDQQKVLEKHVSIPWNETTVKENLWKPIQEAMLQFESTTEADTGDYSQVYNVLARHLQTSLGFNPPYWPSKFR